MLEKARQAERLTAERDAAQERYERYRTAVTVRDEIAELERDPPVAHAAARAPRLRRPPARPSTTKIATLESMLEGEVQVNFEVPPEVAGGRCRAGRSCWSLIGVAIAVVELPAQLLGESSTSASLPIVWAASSRWSALVLAVVGWWLRRGEPADAAAARRRGGPPAARPLRASSRSCARRRPSTTTTPAAARADDVRRGRGAARARGGARRRDRPAAGPPVGPRSATRSSTCCRHGATPPRSRSSRRPRRSRRSGRSPRSRGPASASRSRSPTPSASSTGRRDDEANARARVEQNPVDAEEVAATRRAPRRLAARRWPAPAPRARLRADAARSSTPPSRRRCSARRATSSGAWSRDVDADHRRPLPPGPGRRHQPRHGGLLAGARRLGRR